MSGLTTFQLIAVSIVPLLFAITVHEVAHGWMAKRLGDPTAQRLGRLTLNPVKHIDPVGTVIVPGALLLLGGGFVFGWAKPVPVTWENLRRPKRDMVLVAAAGPGANLLMAVIWALIAKAGSAMPMEMSWVAVPVYYMGIVGVSINVILMIFNLIPLPPLDGGRVAVGLLPGRLAWGLSRVEPYGFFIVLALLMTGILGAAIHPIVRSMTIAVLGWAGL